MGKGPPHTRIIVFNNFWEGDGIVGIVDEDRLLGKDGGVVRKNGLAFTEVIETRIRVGVRQ